jgi:hypothetical protein
MSSWLVESFGDEIFTFRKFRTTSVMEYEVNFGVILMRPFINIYVGDVEKNQSWFVSCAISFAKYLNRVMCAELPAENLYSKTGVQYF